MVLLSIRYTRVPCTPCSNIRKRTGFLPPVPLSLSPGERAVVLGINISIINTGSFFILRETPVSWRLFFVPGCCCFKTKQQPSALIDDIGIDSRLTRAG